MTELSTNISIKRAYEPPAARRWCTYSRRPPLAARTAKDDAHFDQWRKDLSPSTGLRQFYAHRPERFNEFTKRYRTDCAAKRPPRRYPRSSTSRKSDRSRC